MKGRWLAWLALWPALVLASVSAVDDTGQTVTLAQPARRIVSLAPHATESLYAIGAGTALLAFVIGRLSAGGRNKRRSEWV